MHAYCLVDNHYHLLLQTPRANLPEIMHHINGAYTTYFNVKRARSGHLFQGRYKAILVEIDGYAKELSRCLHLNPVRAKEVEAAFAGHARLARSIQMYLCQKYARMKLKDIGTYFGVGQSGDCQAARRVTTRMEMDRRLKKRIDAMEKHFQS